jgi:hypothetical protein
MTATTSSSSQKEPSSERPTKTGWMSLINESVHTSDDIDIGDIDAVSRDFIVVKRGFVKIHYYYIPISKVEGWDGHVLWLKITENEVKGKCERDKIPDPLQYYIKDYPYYTADYPFYATAYYPELAMIPPRYTRPAFKIPSSTAEDMKVPPVIYRCDLCDILFNSQDDLSGHVKENH